MKDGLADLGLLILRLALGGIMFMHGAQKLLGWFGGHGPQGFIAYVSTMGIPAAIAWVGIFVEFAGGIGVVLGILSRIAALGFAVQMLIAILKVHWHTGFFMNWGSVAERGEGWEYPLALLAMSLAIGVMGPGRFSLFGRTRALLA